MNTFVSLSSLSMDLRRVALGYHRGSIGMAERFYSEALKRSQEIDINGVKPYIKRLLEEFPSIINTVDTTKRAEDALMYSILFQNASMKMKNSY